MTHRHTISGDPLRPLGRWWRRLIATVTAEEPRCWLAYPGICTGTSTTADHVVPRHLGGPDTRDNLRGACQPCNRHRRTNPPPTTDHDHESRTWP